MHRSMLLCYTKTMHNLSVLHKEADRNATLFIGGETELTDMISWVQTAYNQYTL